MYRIITTRITKWIFGKIFFAALIFTALSAGTFVQTHPALGGGTGTSGDPYQIKTPAHLKQLADFINAGNGDATAGVYYIVINDLNLTDYAIGEGWNPIGYYISSGNNSYFKGNFDGNNKKVTNLKINRPTTDYQGLFGNTSGAVIENLGVENCDIAGQNKFGGLVGGNSSSSISNCYVTGKVSGVGDISGLVGWNINSTISNCYAAVNVSGTSKDVGGLVGYNDNSTISNCYTTGKVSGTCEVGGLVGWNSSSSISNCYATGNVSGTCDVGGLVGWNSSSSISNCYATGKVSGTLSNVGGLVGWNYYYYSSSTISNCYATGKVSGSDYVGGLVGHIRSSTIKNCIAANDSVVSTSLIIPDNIGIINRICGDGGSGGGTLQNNYALSTMVVKNSRGNVSITSNLNTDAGMSKGMLDFQNLAFYTTAGNWNTATWNINDPDGVWNICDSKSLPFLRWQGISCSGAEVATITATAGIRIYPNPVKDELKIENGELRIDKVEICDLTGKTIYQFDNLKNKINVSALSKGIYIVKLRTGKGIITNKFIKE